MGMYFIHFLTVRMNQTIESAGLENIQQPGCAMHCCPSVSIMHSTVFNSYQQNVTMTAVFIQISLDCHICSFPHKFSQLFTYDFFYSQNHPHSENMFKFLNWHLLYLSAFVLYRSKFIETSLLGHIAFFAVVFPFAKESSKQWQKGKR